MYSIERKASIITLLETDGAVDVAALADRFAVSKETIRRDLREMEGEGVVTRTHGGAVFAGSGPKGAAEYPVAVRSIQRYEEKAQICKRAAGMIQDGDTLFVDNSSSTISLLKYIPPQLHVTVVTNSLQLLIESVKVNNKNLQFVCLGGLFRENNLSVYGQFAQDNASSFYPTKTFLSCHGIDSHNLTDGSIYEVDIKRFMLERSQQTIVLADYTKFGQIGSVYLTDLSSVTSIITDSKVSGEVRERFDSLAVELIVAEDNDTNKK